jgi:O-antigen/teichoic acid export membrane protein
VAAQDPSAADARRMAKGTGIGLAGGAATYVFLVGYSLVVLQALGASGLGVLAAATVVFTLVAETADLGVDFGLIRYATVHIDQGRPEVARGLVFGAWPRVLGGALAMALGVELLAGVVMDGLLQSPESVTPLRILALAIPFSATTDLMVAALKARQTVRESAFVLQFFNPGARVGLAALMWVAGGGLNAFAASFVVGEIVTVIVAYAIARRIVLTGPRVRDRAELRAMMSYSLPLSLNRALLYSNNQTEVLILTRFGSPELVGVFQVCLQLSLVTSAILAAMSAIFSPIVAAAFGRHDRARVAGLYQLSTRWSLMIGLPLFMFVVINTDLITTTLGIPSGATALVILSFGRLVDLATGSVAAVLMVAGYARLSLLNSLLFLGMSLVFDLLLIPPYGLVGAASASAASLILINLLRVSQVWQRVHIQPMQRRLLRVAAAAVVAALPPLLISETVLPGGAAIAVRFAVLLAIYVPLVLTLVIDATDREVLAGVVNRLRPRPTTA